MEKYAVAYAVNASLPLFTEEDLHSLAHTINVEGQALQVNFVHSLLVCHNVPFSQTAVMTARGGMTSGL